MLRRITAALLILLGTLGVLLSALGVSYIWRAARDVTAAADDSLLVVSDTLDDLDRSLDVTSRTLDRAVIAMDGLYTTTLDIGQALSSTQVTLDEMGGLAGDDLPRSIESSLVALEALEETAALIDQLLRTMQQFGVGDYAPETPLDQAVAEAGAGLQPVPESLRTMARGLHQTSASLDGVQGGIALMGDHILGIRENVIDANAAVGSHRRTMQGLQRRVRALRENVDRPIRTAAWGATILVIWIGLSQLAIVRWGISLWTVTRARL